ncbi:MAG: TIGR03364 family FAD-dependent oxidoreductase [Phaeodactylibacter sp.]|nr:TIGR03364 family FAD-dependent oxidoreductase [Phaeodactylibacter sp.]MCB9286994.1 TIGR03364 family FAD-dependent oxidoreductase [Lewinellaceae bacterium]
MAKKYDLIVVGAGILGIFHAYHAAAGKLSVLLLEKDIGPQGATVRNFGQVVPSGMPQGRWQQYGIYATRLYKGLQEQFELGIRQEGSTYIASDEEEAALLEELHEINRANDYPSILLTGREACRRLPGLKAGYARSALFFPEEVTADSRILAPRLLQYLTETMGVEYHNRQTVIECDSSRKSVVVRTAGGRLFQAKQVVICNGSDFQTLFPDIFYHSDIEVTKLQMLETRPQPSYTLPGNVLTGLTIRRYESFKECPSYSTMSHDAAYPRLRELGIHLLFKQTAEGTIYLGDSHEYQDAANAGLLGYEINDEINQLMLREAGRIFDFPIWAVRRAWFGIYAQHKSESLFQYSVDDNIHIVTAIGGKGMTGGAGVAKDNIRTLFNC